MAPRRHERRGAADRIRPHETHGRYPTTPARGTNQPSAAAVAVAVGLVAVAVRGIAVVGGIAVVAVGGLAVAIPATISTISAVAVVIPGGSLGGGEAAERGDGGDCDEGFLEGVHVHVLRVRCRTVRRDQRGEHLRALHDSPPARLRAGTPVPIPLRYPDA